MRRLFFLAVLVPGLAACGGSSQQTSTSVHVAFGTSGGNVRPQMFAMPVKGELANEVQKAFEPGGLANRECPGTLPDIASEYIRVGGRTVTVHGSCERSFTDLWEKLYVRRVN